MLLTHGRKNQDIREFESVSKKTRKCLPCWAKAALERGSLGSLAARGTAARATEGVARRRCGRSLCHASCDVAVASYADHADAGDSERKGIMRQETYKSLIATKK